MGVKLRSYWPMILIFCAVKLIIHLIGNQNYGFHRDELLHMAVAQNPAFGYMEFPPFIAWIGHISWMIFGESLGGLRIFATLAGIAIVVLCCAIAIELGGKRNAVLISGVAILSFLSFYRNHMLFQPVAFDQLFWTLGFYWIVRFFNSDDKKYLIYFGITAGFGLLNKYTFLIYGVAVAIGFLFYQRAAIYRNKWIYIAGGIAFLMILPNLLWQLKYDFPLLKHLEALNKTQLDELGPFDFLLDQIKSLFTFLLSFTGFLALFFNKKLSRYRSFGIMILVIFALMWISGSKGYYFYAAYPLLFAIGAVFIEQQVRKPILIYLIVTIIALPPIYFLPKAIPILPIEKYIAYADLKPDKNGRYELTSDYADMFGWNQQVKLISQTYNSLTKIEQQNCIILAKNYGEAGAIKVLGKKYNLPAPVCASGSFWLDGAGKTSGKICISIGLETDILDKLYSDHQLVKQITHPYAIDEENNIPIYINRNPKISLKTIWPSLEKEIFN